MSADGGAPQVLTTLDAGRRDSSHRLPEVLTGGEGVVFTVKADDTRSWDDARIEAVSLRTRERSVWVLQLDGDRKPRPFLHGPYKEHHAVLSPSGRWLAYVSDESGREEVYVRPFPGSRGRWLISTDGGTQPVWARNGRELFYRNGDRMMAVTVTSDATFTATKPRLLFEARAMPEIDTPTYDVTPNGEFLMIESGESEALPSQLNVVLNWLQEVRPRVAAR